MKRISLLLALIILLSVAYFVARSNEPAPASEDDPIFGGLEKEVDSLRIANDSLNLLAVRRGDNWFLVLPVKDRASRDLADVVEFLRASLVARVVERDAPDLSPYGLQVPRATVSLDGREVTIGSFNPTGDGIYLCRGGGSRDVLLAGKGFDAIPRLGAGRLRDRTPLLFPIRDILHIGLDGELQGDATRKGKIWSLTRSGVRASASDVWRLAAAIRESRIHRFLDEKRPAMSDASLLVVVQGDLFADTLAIGDPVPGAALRQAWASDRSMMFLVPVRLVDSLNVHVDSILDSRLFLADPRMAERVVVERSGVRQTLVRREQEPLAGGGEPVPFWLIDGDPKRPASRTKVIAFLENLSSRRVVGAFPPSIGSEGFHPVLMIEVDGERIEFDLRDRDSSLGRRVGEEGVLLLGEGLYFALQTDPADLESPAK